MGFIPYNYSHTKCPKCQAVAFELAEDTPTGSNWKMYYLRCASCKTFLHATPFLHTNKILDNILTEIGKLKTKLGIYP